MKYHATTKNWKSIGKDVTKVLNDKESKPTVYICKDGFISEVSFVTKIKGGGIAGFTYGSDQCSQPLLKRIAKLIPKKFVEKV